MSEPPDELPDDVPPMMPFPSSRLIGAAAPGPPPAGSSSVRPRSARARRSGGRRATLDTAQEIAGLLLLAIVALVGGTVLHARFAAKEALCNTVGGALAQQQSTGAAAHCGLYSFLSGMGEIVRWGGMLGLVFCAIAFWVVWSSRREA